MGKVFPKAAMSSQHYHIGIPVSVKTKSHDQQDDDNSVETFDLSSVIRAAHSLIDDSSNDARSLINDARQRAKDILNTALEQADELEKKGYKDGLERARSQQDHAIEQAVVEAREALENIVEMIRVAKRQFFIEAEQGIIDLIFDVAKKIIQREVVKDEETTITVVRSALKRLSERDRVTIRVAPEDLDAVRAQRELFLHENDLSDIRIIPDPRVDRGGVIIETDSGSIDGRIDAQLEVAKEAIQDIVGDQLRALNS